jgi:YHS domain-containing protein
MVVNETLEKYKTEHFGKIYYFYKEVCKVRFEANPYYYLNKG